MGAPAAIVPVYAPSTGRGGGTTPVIGYRIASTGSSGKIYPTMAAATKVLNTPAGGTGGLFSIFGDVANLVGGAAESLVKSPIGGLTLSFLLPGVGSAIAGALLDEGIVTSEVAANVLGNAIANTAASVAQGQPLDKALTNAVVGVAVNTGSIEAAKEANALFGHPAVSDAIISAAGSAAKTAAAGGTEQDIVKNMTGALAGSAASSAYQKAGDGYTRETGRVIGSAVAGAVTGGTTGAITGAVGELGGQAKGKVSGAIEDTLKGTTDTGALPASQVAAMTPTTDSGSPITSDAGALKPGLPNIEVVEKKLPDITGTNIISPSGTTDKKVLDLIAASKDPNAVLKPVEVSAKKPPSTDITKTDIIEETPKLDDVTVTAKSEEPAAAAPEEKKPEEKPPEEKPYEPNLFILGGKQPKAPTKPSTSVLGQALGITTGLTASRGAGEIEDPSTGKKKRKVWNEETLRLKDALGV
jgi:hypothetical protein